MAYNSNKNLKLYYSAKEVAELVHVPVSTLRFWEKEIRSLKPKKTDSGVRQYTQEDIELVKLIYHLVKEKGLTVKGASARLQTSKEHTVHTLEVVDRLKAVREELMTIKEELDALTAELPPDGYMATSAYEQPPHTREI